MRIVRFLTITALLFVLVGFSTGCGTVERATAIGAGIGGVVGTGAGLALGAVTGNPAKGAAIGGVAGTAIGAAIGHEQGVRAEREKNLREAKIAAAQPQEVCNWAYDHTGQYAWKCTGHEGPRPTFGPPQANFGVPPAWTPAPAGSTLVVPEPTIAQGAPQPTVVYVRRHHPRYHYDGRWHHVRPVRAHVTVRVRF